MPVDVAGDLPHVREIIVIQVGLADQERRDGECGPQVVVDRAREPLVGEPRPAGPSPGDTGRRPSTV
jgi:hypothetical protein